MNDALISWLLQAETPTIRYLTLTRMLDRPENSPEVREARRSMQASGPIPAILARQTSSGAWAGEHSYYTPKYTGTHWSLLLLAELHADPGDPRLAKGVDFMLNSTRPEWLDPGRGGLACFWGNLLRYAAQFAPDHPGVNEVVACLERDAVQGGWRCEYNGGRPCAWGAARALWGLAALAEERRTPGVEDAIQAGLAFLLEEYSLAGGEYPPEGKVSKYWARLNYPLFYQADVLFVLRMLVELNARDHPGARPALDWLASKRQANGRWRGASPFRSRTWKALGGPGETYRWITWIGLYVLGAA